MQLVPSSRSRVDQLPDGCGVRLEFLLTNAADAERIVHVLISRKALAFAAIVKHEVELADLAPRDQFVVTSGWQMGLVAARIRLTTMPDALIAPFGDQAFGSVVGIENALELLRSKRVYLAEAVFAHGKAVVK